LYLHTLTRPPTSPHFPYTTLFRSLAVPGNRAQQRGSLGCVSAKQLLHHTAARENFFPARGVFSPRVFNAASSASQSSAVVSQPRSEEHTSELQSLRHLVCRLLLEK